MSDFINTTDVLGDDAVCDAIIERTLSEYCDNRITAIGDYSFYSCSSLEKLDIPNVISIGTFAFYSCSSLTYVNIPNVTTIETYSFSNDNMLESISIPLVTSIPKSAFRNSSALATAILPLVTSIDSYAFYNCTALTKVILSSETVCELLNTNAFGNTSISNGNGYIYVPDSLVETYKLDTNWSTYSEQIKGLSEMET